MAGHTPSAEDDLEVEFSMGSVMWRALAVLSRNIVPFSIISAAAGATPFFYAWRHYGPVRSGATVLEVLLFPVFHDLGLALIVYAAVLALSGRRVRFDVSIWRGLQRAGPVLVTSVLTLGIMLIGFVLLLVPGLIATVVLYVAIPACVLERLGPVQSIKRSVSLTRGCGWRIFAVSYAVLIVTIAGNWLIGVLTPAAPGWLPPALAFGWMMLSNAYEAVLIAVIYYQLRIVKDGTDPSGIAAVFD
jgi:hypothetical protein